MCAYKVLFPEKVDSRFPEKVDSFLKRLTFLLKKLLHLNHFFLKKCWLCATFLLSLHPETV